MSKLSALLLFCTMLSPALCYVSIQLQHALVNDHFTHRGNVSNVDSSPLPTQNRLKDDELENLKRLAQNNDYYRLRAIVSYSNGATKTYLTATKACNLLAAELNDILWISIDANGFVNSITQTVAASSSEDCITPNLLGLREFYTEISTLLTEQAPIPDTASFVQKVEREREQREKGVTDNRGFFAKYWMYIVPVVLLVFISGATNQDAAK